MKKKKNLKKKILGISLSALLVSLPFVTNRVETVNAAENCTPFYADYVYLMTGTYDTENFQNKTEPWEKIRSSNFPMEHPENAVLENDKMSEEWIIAEGGAIHDVLNYWSKAKIATDIVKVWGDNVGRGTPIKASNNHWIYFHDKYHFGEEITDGSTASQGNVDYDTNEIIESMIFPKNESYGTSVKSQLITEKMTGEDSVVGSIKRTFSVNAMHTFGDSMAARGSGSSHPTETRWWAPAIYRVTYQVCSGSSDSSSGDSNNNDSSNVTNYNLTINYLDKSENKISNPVSAGSTLDNPSVQSKAAGSTYSVVCPSDLKSGSTNYILAGKPDNASGIMNSNKTVNCVYTTSSTQTSDIPIFIVWGIGGAALAYSIYFFRKYYKEQNQE